MGSTSGGSTSGVGSTTGSTTGQSCGTAWVEGYYDGGYLPTECGAGLVELKGRIVDSYTSDPITQSFTVADIFTNLAGSTAPCGVYWFCVDAGTRLTPEFQVPGYVPTEVATVVVESNGSEIPGRGGLPVVQKSDIMLFQEQSYEPAFDPNQAVIYTYLRPGSGACASAAGWTYLIRDLDGGLVDAGALYLSGLQFVQGGATTDSEITILYDIDPNVRSVQLTLVPDAGLGDGGSPCPNLGDLAPYEFTEAIPVGLSTISWTEYVMPY